MQHDINQMWENATSLPDETPTREQIKTTEADQMDIDAEAAKLASLPLGEYERHRKEEAKRLGVRASILDKLVAPLRETKGGQGGEFKLVDPEPWDSPVSGAELLDDLRAAFCRYISLPDGAAEVSTLMGSAHLRF